MGGVTPDTVVLSMRPFSINDNIDRIRSNIHQHVEIVYVSDTLFITTFDVSKDPFPLFVSYIVLFKHLFGFKHNFNVFQSIYLSL